jgi:phage terminase large subunit GpA-like protein
MTAKYLSEAEIEALLPPPELSVIEWVEKHRILPMGNAIPGPKRIDRTPSLRAVYEWFNDYRVREITCQKPAQCGFTDLVVDLILWICENDPSPTVLFLADRMTAEKIMKYRIVPALKGLGKLVNDENNRKKEATKIECSFSNGFYLAVSWGSSISQTASMSFKYVFCDEINKPGYDVSGDEGDTLGRIRERMETYPDSKFIKFSTPTTDSGRVTKELNKADVVYDFCVPCPDCGFIQPLTFRNVKWEGGSRATREQIEKTARYVCSNCGSLWTTIQKNKAVEKGVFVPREKVENPKHIGLQLHRLASLFKGGYLENMIDRWNKAQEDGPTEIQNVINSGFGEPWINRISEPESERRSMLLQCKADYDILTVPEEAVCLVAGVDVQNDGCWFRIRAFASDMTSWSVFEGFSPTWDDLQNVLFQTYGNKRIWRTLIDTGGGKDSDKQISRTEETYNFIRQNQKLGMRIMGAKGSSWSMPNKIKVGSPIDKTPSGKPIPGGLKIVQINTYVFKDLFWWRVDKSLKKEPGGLYFHSSTPDYVFDHLLAEEKIEDKDGSCDWVAVKKDNHLFDCEVLCLACVDVEFYAGIKAACVMPPRRHNNNASGGSSSGISESGRTKRVNPYTEGIR